MAGAGTLVLSGTLAGLPSGQRTISVSLPIVAAIDASMEPILSVGDNTITVPSGANGVIIDPPSANTVALLLKGTGSDVGLSLHRTLATVWMIGPAQSTFVINAASALSGPLQLTFF